MRRALAVSAGQGISIHALLAESDQNCRWLTFTYAEFLSTLSLRRATAGTAGAARSRRDFYPRSPCGERLILPIRRPGSALFLSTLSLRRATTDAVNGCNPDYISIHALLAESDLFALLCNLLHHNFYPRSPCGERRHRSVYCQAMQVFLSTLSLRRATANIYETVNRNRISIHALLAESDIS